MNKIKLFCFPYAGGSSMVFSRWKKYLSTEIELVPVELAGRGKRIHEDMYEDFRDAVEDVFQLIKDEIEHVPYALFGHSMGALIAYELAQKIRYDYVPQPLHLFFSGKGAPDLEKEDEKKYHLMNEQQFREEVIKLGGTPPELFEQPELLDLFLPILRNDFKIVETAPHNKEINPMDGSFTVFLGKDDDLTAEQCDSWKKHTRQVCTLHYFEGGHFFLNEQMEPIARIINHTLLRIRPDMPIAEHTNVI